MDITTNLITTLRDYSNSRSLNFELDELDAPPPILQGRTRGPGICLTVKEPEPTGDSPAQLGVWLSTSCSEVTCCMMREGDDEIKTEAHTIPDDEARMAFVADVCRQFCLHYVFIPAIEAWADDADIGYEIIKPVDFAGEATLYNCREWFFIEFKTPKPGEYDLTVGISGDGKAATFTDIHGDGWLDFDDPLTEVKSGTEIKSWLQRLL